MESRERHIVSDPFASACQCMAVRICAGEPEKAPRDTLNVHTVVSAVAFVEQPPHAERIMLWQTRSGCKEERGITPHKRR